MIDTSVYPDLDHPPTTLESEADRADYVARICGAWDFGIVPTPDTFRLFASWRDVFDRHPLLHSPAYAAFRLYYGWPPVSITILEAPYERADRAAGRMRPDPCTNMV